MIAVYPESVIQMAVLATSTSAAKPQNSTRQPTMGSNHCTGKVEATMPNEPVISIHEFARNWVVVTCPP